MFASLATGELFSCVCLSTEQERQQTQAPPEEEIFLKALSILTYLYNILLFWGKSEGNPL